MDVRRLAAALIVSCALCAGCTSQQESSVSGTVSYAGKPLATGAVGFHPTSPGPPAIGHIQPDGSYTLHTGEAPGLKAGEYLVTLVATGPMPEPTPADPMPLPKLLIPARYGDVKTSGLKYNVTPGVNTINIDLAE